MDGGFPACAGKGRCLLVQIIFHPVDDLAEANKPPPGAFTIPGVEMNF
jgi:hypothetical protein